MLVLMADTKPTSNVTVKWLSQLLGNDLGPKFLRHLCVCGILRSPALRRRTCPSFTQMTFETVLGTLPELLRMVQVTPILQPCQQLGQHGSPIAVW